AVRFATKLDMTIAPATEKPIKELASLLDNIPPARLFEETLKLFLNGKAEENFLMLRRYNLFKSLFPALDSILDKNPGGLEFSLIQQMFR
ncbi:polynucleotide adenylyltransferase PcnB, partial [Streptomyces scabiei]